jgi:hypothetical protein
MTYFGDECSKYEAIYICIQRFFPDYSAEPGISDKMYKTYPKANGIKKNPGWTVTKNDY